MIFDHYLAIQTWSKSFISPAAQVTKTLAWIRIPGLSVAFYDESFIMSVAQVIGKPVRLDMNTLRGERGRFARICVELDLTKPVIGKIMIEDYWYKVVYEGLHVICTKCGCYGHRSRECSGEVLPPEKTKPSQGVPPPPGNSQILEEHRDQGLSAPTKTAPPVATAGSSVEISENTGDNMEINEELPNLSSTNTGNASSGKGNIQSALNGEHVQEIADPFGDWMVVSKRKKQRCQVWKY